MPEPICTTEGAAELLGVHPATAKRMVASGKLPPEATVGGRSLWRCETLARWDAIGRPEGSLPISPTLRVWGVAELAERFRVSDHLVKKWRLAGLLAEPTWEVAGLLLWDYDTVVAMTPECPTCEMPVHIVGSRSANGKPTEVECSCGTYVVMSPREAA